MSTPWLEARLDGLTGTDAGAILGVCPWKSPLQVWAEKTRRIVSEDIGHIERVRWGNLLEPVIVAEACLRTGRAALPDAEWDAAAPHARAAFMAHGDVTKGMLFSTRWDWLRVTPDALVRDADGAVWVLEAKAVGAFKRGDWLDGGPLLYRVQLMANTMAAGLELGCFAALVGGNELFPIDHHLDEWLGAAMIAKLEAFWREHVMADIPPPATELDAETIALLWPTRADTPPLEFEPHEAIAVRELDRILGSRTELSSQLRELDKRRAAINNQVRQALGQSPRGRTPDGLIVEARDSSQYLKLRREAPETNHATD